MPTVQHTVQAYLRAKDITAKDLSERSGVNLLTINALLADGSLPRKAEHRENLRVVLGIDKESWAKALMESCDLPLIEDENAPLQVLIAHHMFKQGLTERGLSMLCGVPYGTVLGVVRKGAIPRGNSLNKIGDALGIEPRLVAAAMQRSGGNPDLLPAPPPEDFLDDGLAPLVAKRIRNLGLTIGSYAEKLGVGYFQLSRFLDSGTPPTDSQVLTALREDLDIDEDSFYMAVETGTHKPKPGTVSARMGEPPPDANPLQQVLMRYMNARKMTIKALAQELQLSQITVSRLVKQGVRPSRQRTHTRLRQLLDLSEFDYGELLAGRLKDATSKILSKVDPGSEALTPKTSSQRRSGAPDYPGTEALIPKRRDDGDEFMASDSDHISDQELIRLIKKLGPQQRSSLLTFLRSLSR